MISNHITIPFKGRSIKVWLLLKRLHKKALLGERLKMRNEMGRSKHHKVKSPYYLRLHDAARRKR